MMMVWPVAQASAAARPLASSPSALLVLLQVQVALGGLQLVPVMQDLHHLTALSTTADLLLKVVLVVVSVHLSLPVADLALLPLLQSCKSGTQTQ
jgi:hypothetical protein